MNLNQVVAILAMYNMAWCVEDKACNFPGTERSFIFLSLMHKIQMVCINPLSARKMTSFGLG